MNNRVSKGLAVVDQHLSEHQVNTIENISPYLKDLVIEFGMGEIYAREGLDAKSRKVATIASLVTSGNVEQIKWHVAGGLASGLITQQEVNELIYQMVLYVGFPKTLNAMKAANEVFEQA